MPKDWLRLQRTGECVSEMSDASGTLWLDVGQRRWSEPMLAACELNLSHMPRLAEGCQVSGTLSTALAKAWGLPAGVRGWAGRQMGVQRPRSARRCRWRRRLCLMPRRLNC